MITANVVAWALRLNIVHRLKIDIRRSFVHFWKSIICTDQLDVQEANVSISQLHRIRDHLAGCWVCVWMFYLRSTCGFWSLKCRERSPNYQNQPKRAHGKPVHKSKAHPTIRMWIYRTQIKFLRTHITLRRNHSCTSLSIAKPWSKWSSSKNEVQRWEIFPAPTELLWIGCLTDSSWNPRFESNTLTPRTNSQHHEFSDAFSQPIKYVEFKNQLADILTEGSITRDEWYNLLHILNIMETIVPTAIIFIPQKSSLRCREDIRKALRLDR